VTQTPGSEALVLGQEIREALADGRGVVALETSVIGQGLPSPRNLECIDAMGGAIRTEGAVPAWIGVLDGSVRVGLTQQELARFAKPGAATKVARRDLAMAVATGAMGATTVSATIWASARAGLAVAATGGIGGVHPQAFDAGGADARSSSWPDVSADLKELAETPGLLVCSGPKSIVDPVATAEKLEELGVIVVGFGVDRLPYFLAREAPVELEHRVESASEAADLLVSSRNLGLASTILLCNPGPQASAMDRDEVAAAAAEAEAMAERDGVRGKARTPFLLAALAEITGGRSLESNLALLEDNARVAGRIAAAFAATDPTRGAATS
jgi:pseudouridine-5'-phosphate glycosidase